MTQGAEFETRLQQLQAYWQALPDKPEETADNTLRALWLAAAGSPYSAVWAADVELPPLDRDAAQRLDTVVEQRIAGVPLAHLTGRQHFMGLELLAGPEALIPRRETELLAQAAIDLAQASLASNGSAIVVDICTGSGNLALAVAHHSPGARVHGADLSEDAVALARRNATMLDLTASVDFRTGDLLAPFDSPDFVGNIDVLICNPPYISSGKVENMAQEISGHEPRLAFDGGPLGISILARLMQDAPRYLRPGGWLAFEVGYGQGSGMARRLRNDGAWGDVREIVDGDGAIRAVLAQRKVDPSGEQG